MAPLAGRLARRAASKDAEAEVARLLRMERLEPPSRAPLGGGRKGILDGDLFDLFDSPAGLGQAGSSPPRKGRPVWPYGRGVAGGTLDDIASVRANGTMKKPPGADNRRARSAGRATGRGAAPEDGSSPLLPTGWERERAGGGNGGGSGDPYPSLDTWASDRRERIVRGPLAPPPPPLPPPPYPGHAFHAPARCHPTRFRSVSSSP